MKKNLPVTQQEAGFPETANILSTTNLKGAITYVNEDFVKVSGFNREELLGNNHNMVRHPDMPPAAFAQLWTRVKSGNSWMGLVKNRCKNGDHYWVDAYVTPILEDGKVAEYQSVRRAPNRQAVVRAEKLYAALSAGKKPQVLRNSLSFNVRLQCWLLLPLLALLAGMFWLESVALMAGIVLCALGVAMLGQWLTLSPLRHAVAKARRVIRDPVGQYVYTGRKDEVGEILLAFKALEAESAGLVGRISDSAGSMMQGATSMDHAVGSSSDGIRRQFAETDQVAAAINEMSASVQEVAHNAQQTSNMANSGLESVVEGKEVVSKTQSLIQSLRQEIAEGGKVIRQVKQSSSDIASVLDVIKAIAEQTNLLALNAAIEAARAGDSGRGFAVVADEVRSLASRTQASTENIREMIDALESGSSRAVLVMEAGERHAEDCVEQGQLTVTALDDIYQSIQGIRDMSTQIATAVEQQSQVAEEINRSIANIRQLSESNLGLVEESKVSSGGMLGVANRFEELAAQFWSRQGV